MTAERGVIRNRERASQINDFSGLRWGNITPTDVDAMVEFGGRLFVLMECKTGNVEISTGQRLALMRVAAAIHQPPRRYAAIVWARSDHAVEEDIDYAMLYAVQCWWPGDAETDVSGFFRKDMNALDKHWTHGGISVKDMIDALRTWVGCN